MTTEAPASNQLALINPEAFTDLITSAPDVLAKNQTSVQRANAAGQTIIDTIEVAGMSDELDAEANNFQAKIRVTYNQMQERRKPITQILDEVKKAFTSLELSIDPKNSESLFAKVQTYRDKYAQKKKAAQKAEEQALLKLIAIEKEKNETRANADILLSNSFNAFLTTKLNEMSALLNEATLETIDTKAHILINYPEQYPESHFTSLSVASISSKIAVSLITIEQVAEIVQQAKDAKKEVFSQQYTLDIQSHKEILSLNVRARRNELEEKERIRIQLEKENDQKEKDRLLKEKERLEKEESDRKLKEEQDLINQSKQRQESDTKEAEATKETANMQTLFDASAETQQAASSIKEAYEIEVTNLSAYLLLAQFWMEKEGMKLSADEIEKKTFKQMKTFCEKHALKTEEKIKSPYIIYKEVAKATVKRG